MKLKKKKILSLLLIVAMLITSVAGCSSNNIQHEDELSSSSIDIESIVDAITTEIAHENETQETIENIIEIGKEFVISTDWRDYVGDIDTFVYGLLGNEYNLCYDTFNGAIELEDGSVIYGLAYTDYSCYFEKEDEEGGYFPTGFIPFIGEEEIPKEYVEKGIEVYNLDYEDDQIGFVLCYDTEPYMEHCVIWNQYLKYGIDNNGCITYEVSEFAKENCDETLGALYSYDNGRFLYNPNVGEYQYITGQSLSAQIDYEELNKQINEILENQEKYLAQVDIEKTVYFAQEAINSYLLSLQEETFMGFNVEQLIEISKELDPMSCIQITPDGLILVEIEKTPPKEASAFMKWTTGIICGALFVGSIAASIFVPALVPAMGAIGSAAMEIFMEVVVSNHSIENVNWMKVGVSAVSGALLAWACPMLGSAASKGIVNVLGTSVSKGVSNVLGQLAGYAVLTLSNAVVSGATNAAFAAIDGGDSTVVLNAFLSGAAIGGALTAGVVVLSSIASTGMKILAAAKPNNFITKAMDGASNFIADHQVHLFSDKVENILVPKSIYASTRAAIKEVYGSAYIDKLTMNKIVSQLPGDDNPNFQKYDINGNPIGKNEVIKAKGECIIKLKDGCDKEIAQLFDKFGVSEIRVVEGIPQLDGIAEGKFVEAITTNRGTNMAAFKKYLANNPSVIPDKLKDQLLELNNATSLDQISLNAKKIGDAMSACSLTFHEGADGVVYIVDTFVHSKLSHYGGVAYAGIIQKIDIGLTHMQDLYATQTTTITGTLIMGGA